MRTTLRALLLQWHDHRAQRREAQALDAIGEMDAHMLRDIGAPEQWVARAATRRGALHWRDVPFQLSAAIVAIVLTGVAPPTSAAEATPRQTTSKALAQAQIDGIFTGEFVDGAPVYRFPSVIVVAIRKAEPAKREKHSPRRQTRATSGSAGPV